MAFDFYADPAFIAGAAAINQANANATADYGYGNVRGTQTYGYDSSGNLDRGGVGYNPYNQAQILQRSYDVAKRGTTNSYAARGQLYSGALNKAQDANTYNYNLGSDQLQRAADDYYHGLDVAKRDTELGGQQNFANLILDALNRFIASQGS